MTMFHEISAWIVLKFLGEGVCIFCLRLLDSPDIDWKLSLLGLGFLGFQRDLETRQKLLGRGPRMLLF